MSENEEYMRVTGLYVSGPHGIHLLSQGEFTVTEPGCTVPGPLGPSRLHIGAVVRMVKRGNPESTSVIAIAEPEDVLAMRRELAEAAEDRTRRGVWPDLSAPSPILDELERRYTHPACARRRLGPLA